MILDPRALDTAETMGMNFLHLNLVSAVGGLLRAKIHTLSDQLGYIRTGRNIFIP